MHPLVSSTRSEDTDRPICKEVVDEDVERQASNRSLCGCRRFAAVRAMERFRIPGPGTHVVKVQATPLNGTGLSFRLSDWALVIQRSLK